MTYQPHVSPWRATALIARSAAITGWLLFVGRLSLPRTLVGSHLSLPEGNMSLIFRETVLGDGVAHDPARLIVRFRLRWIGRSAVAHAVFRTTCVLNTPLFAGFSGFSSKLWLVDPVDYVYRGVYEWNGADRAHEYAQALGRALALVCVKGSVSYRVEPGVRRDDPMSPGVRTRAMSASTFPLDGQSEP